MIRFCKKVLMTAALCVVIIVAAKSVRGDSLITVDGETLVGSVTQITNAYKVETANGTITIAADRVKQIIYDHPPASVEKPAAPAPVLKTVDSREVTALTQQGLAAMAAGEFADARDAFCDLLEIDPKNPTAGRGLGFAYLKLDKPVKALRPLEIAAVNPPLDRSLTLALASSLVASHDPMRAVKFVKAYLEAHPTPIDEPVVNALGISLSRANSAAAKTDLFIDGIKLYNRLNADLEARQHGKKRWGVVWEDADQVTKKSIVREAAQKIVDDAWAKLQSANMDLTTAQTELNGASNYPARQETRDKMVQAAQKKVNTASNAVEKAQSAFDLATKALEDVPGPEWPDVIVLDAKDLTMPPPVANRPGESASLKRYAAGFAIAPNIIVTAASALDDASDIQVTDSDGKTRKAEIIRMLHGDGLAMLKVEKAAFPCLGLATRPTGGSLVCVGLPDVALFNPAAKQLHVTSNDPVSGWEVSFGKSPRLPGAPLMKNGQVVGVELVERDEDLSHTPAATLKSLLLLVEDKAHGGSPATDPAQAIVLVTASR